MTAFTTPITAAAGQAHLATDWNEGVRDNWAHATEIQAWSPTLVQSNTVARTLSYGRYWQTGDRVHAQCFLTASAAGTSGQNITVSLPVTGAATIPQLLALGVGWIYDSSAATFYQGAVLLNSSTTAGLRIHNSAGFVGAAQVFALASGDIVSFCLDYEAA